MKKEIIISTIIYLLMLVIVLLVGYFVISANAESIKSSLGNNQNSIYWFVAVSLLIGLVINVFLVEIGHVIGAKIGGYNILTFNVFGLCLYKVKEEEKIKFKLGIKSFTGLSGETKIYPNINKNKHSLSFYVLMPLILILLEFLGLYLTFFFSVNSSVAFIAYGYVLIATIGGIFILYDYIPFRLDSLTDGYLYTILFSKKVNQEAFNNRLNIEKDIAFNIDKEEFIVFPEITDYTAENNMMAIYSLISKNELDTIKNILDSIIESKNKLNKITKLYAKTWKIYFYIKENNIKEAKKLYESFSDLELKEFKNPETLFGIRTLLLYLCKVEGSFGLITDLERSYYKLYKVIDNLTKDDDEKLFKIELEEIKKGASN